MVADATGRRIRSSNLPTASPAWPMRQHGRAIRNVLIGGRGAIRDSIFWCPSARGRVQHAVRAVASAVRQACG